MNRTTSKAMAWCLAVALLPLAACDKAAKDLTGSGVGGDAQGAAAHYGFAPQQNGAVTYQPDVVFIGGGPAAIRAASGDGLTWYLDKKAAGADQLAVGKVMYATSLAVGRVVLVRPDGDKLAVTLAPVRLGEVIKNGRVTVSQPVDLSGWGLRQVPDLPGAVASTGPVATASPSAKPSATATTAGAALTGPDLSGGAAELARPAAYRVAQAESATLPPPFREGSAPWSAGSWSGQVSRSSGDVTLHVEHTGDLKTDIDVKFHFASPHLDADLGIVDGEVGDSEIRLRGLREVSLDIRAGSAKGLSDNLQQKIEIPVSLDAPVIVGGVAMNLNVRFKFLAQTAFTAKNSTLEASGAWTTDGPLSYDRTSGKVGTEWPKVTAKKDILDSLSGVSIGVNGFVFATEMRVMLGLGVPAVNAGPYVRMVTSVGLTVGSDAGIVKCRQATVTVTAGTGMALSMSDSVVSGINALFRKLGVTKPVESDNTKQVYEREVYKNSFWAPNVAACRLS